MSANPVRAQLAASMPEAQLLAAVRDACAIHGALCYHTHDSRRSEAGFPDLVIVTKDGRLLFRELKTAKGELRPAQESWLAALIDAGADAAVWRPMYLLDGSVDRVLSGEVLA